MKLLDFLTHTKNTETAPKGFCPNCWGHQEYLGGFRATLEKEKIDLKNVGTKKGWVQAYAAKHFEGIRLKKSDDITSCPACKLTYPNH